MRRIFIGTSMLLLTGCSASQTPNQTPKQALLEEAHNAVREKLKDPESAQFKDELAFASVEKAVVCMGEVNSKNGFGGYTGFQKYWFTRSGGAATQDETLDVWKPLSDICLAAMNEETKRLNEETNRTNESVKLKE